MVRNKAIRNKTVRENWSRMWGKASQDRWISDVSYLSRGWGLECTSLFVGPKISLHVAQIPRRLPHFSLGMYHGDEEWDQLRYSAKIFSVEKALKKWLVLIYRPTHGIEETTVSYKITMDCMIESVASTDSVTSGYCDTLNIIYFV